MSDKRKSRKNYKGAGVTEEDKNNGATDEESFEKTQASFFKRALNIFDKKWAQISAVTTAIFSCFQLFWRMAFYSWYGINAETTSLNLRSPLFLVHWAGTFLIVLLFICAGHDIHESRAGAYQAMKQLAKKGYLDDQVAYTKKHPNRMRRIKHLRGHVIRCVFVTAGELVSIHLFMLCIFYGGDLWYCLTGCLVAFLVLVLYYWEVLWEWIGGFFLACKVVKIKNKPSSSNKVISPLEFALICFCLFFTVFVNLLYSCTKKA